MKKILRFFDWVIENFDLVWLLVTVLVCFVVSFLDLFNVLEIGEKSIPYLTLTLIASIAIYLVVERRKNLESGQKELLRNLQLVADGVNSSRQQMNDRFSQSEQELDRAAKRLIYSLKGVDVQQFENAITCVNYATRRIKEAKSEVRDSSWGLRSGFSAAHDKDQSKGKEHWQAPLESLYGKESFCYREIYVFNEPRKLKKLEHYIKQHNMNALPGYFCAYFDEIAVPVIQFMIIDQDEVIFMTEQYPPYLAVRNELIVQLFTRYYEDLWTKAITIKKGRHFVQAAVDEIRLKYAKRLEEDEE